MTNGIACHFATGESETHNQALKRKYDELQHDRDELNQVLTLMASKNEREAFDIFHRVRTGQDARTILEMFKCRSPLVKMQASPCPKQLASQELISGLMRSSASLEDAVSFLEMIRSAKNLQIPSMEAHQALRSHLTGIGTLRKLVDQANLRTRISIADLLVNDRPAKQESPVHYVAEIPNSCKVVPFRVPAAPWTYLTQDEELVSHLVSLFLIWANPSLRFVEEDLFLAGMRSGDLESDYCSPFLVHTILALGSVSE